MEDGWVHQALGFGGAILGGLVAVVYQQTHKRIDGVEDDVEKKADHLLVMLSDAKIDRMMEKLDGHISDETLQFGKIYEALHANHVEVIRELNKKTDK